jgi:hypothetical protein
VNSKEVFSLLIKNYASLTDKRYQINTSIAALRSGFLNISLLLIAVYPAWLFKCFMVASVLIKSTLIVNFYIKSCLNRDVIHSSAIEVLVPKRLQAFFRKAI